MYETSSRRDTDVTFRDFSRHSTTHHSTVEAQLLKGDWREAGKQDMSDEIELASSRHGTYLYFSHCLAYRSSVVLCTVHDALVPPAGLRTHPPGPP